MFFFRGLTQRFGLSYLSTITKVSYSSFLFSAATIANMVLMAEALDLGGSRVLVCAALVGVALYGLYRALNIGRRDSKYPPGKSFSFMHSGGIVNSYICNDRSCNHAYLG